jgi:asparagine synthase (glutamine-hydrolysing)
MDDAQKQALYSPMMHDALGGRTTEAWIRNLMKSCASDDPTNRALFLDLETLLPDQVLPFVDRLSMAHSVEVRPPFLDHRIAEFACSLPGSIKIKAGRVKSILKDAVRDLLPPALIERPKEGFIMPINEWLIEKLGGFVRATLSPERLKSHGLFRPEAVARMIDAHFRGEARYGDRIWNLLMLQLWWEAYIDRKA